MFALEPRTDAHTKSTHRTNLWPPPALIQSVAGRVRIPNLTGEPLVLKRREQFCLVSPVFLPHPDISHTDGPEQDIKSTPQAPHPVVPHPTHSATISLDPDNTLNPDMHAKFRALHDEYDEVFNPTFPGYNGAAGPFEAVVNMGPVPPPQRKGRLPQYAQDKLRELQLKFDARPEDVGITVEYLNPSFLIKKQSGGFRLVTAFADVGRYSKPQPSLMPDVDSTLRNIAQWKYLIATDLIATLPLTVVCPKSTTILGWIWSGDWFNGTIQASPHRVATLSTCSTPDKIGGLKSFIGAFKVLSRVIPDCSSLMFPLDGAVAGRQAKDKRMWSDDIRAAFKSALTSTKTITLPRPDDQLWIVTDGSVKQHSIGSTLYITRNARPHLAGFFSAKLRGRQPTWLPCEVEALSISASTKHFSPFIIQSTHHACILTDSKPCVQAFVKLCRGEFSASPRVSTFLSTVSRYQASVQHLAGSANVPSDFASRNAPTCTDPTCKICAFVKREEESTVLRISAEVVISGNTKLPFTSRAAWSEVQSECPDLRRTHACSGDSPIKETYKHQRCQALPPRSICCQRWLVDCSP